VDLGRNGRKYRETPTYQNQRPENAFSSRKSTTTGSPTTIMMMRMTIHYVVFIHLTTISKYKKESPNATGHTNMKQRIRGRKDEEKERKKGLKRNLLEVRE
jgi:hypothetical protein